VSCEAESAEELKAVGLRRTKARSLVLSALRHADRHMRATEVIGEVSRRFGRQQRSTVYRALGALRDARLISETHLGHGEAIYEWVGVNPHHHLVCSACGGVTDLDNSVIADLAHSVGDRHGFQADLTHLALGGVCPDCQRAETKEENGGREAAGPSRARWMGRN